MIYSYIPSFLKICSAIQKLLEGGIHIQARRQQGDLISLHLFFENKGSKLKQISVFRLSQQ
jgi:hypothetical protein